MALGTNSSTTTRTEMQRGSLAGGTVGDRLRATEAALGQDLVEVAGAPPDQVGEDLPPSCPGRYGHGEGAVR